MGAATTAAMREMQDSFIKTLGRWESSAYLVYIRTPRSALISASRSLVGPHHHFHPDTSHSEAYKTVGFLIVFVSINVADVWQLSMYFVAVGH